jgi:hypothetical protein
MVTLLYRDFQPPNNMATAVKKSTEEKTVSNFVDHYRQYRTTDITIKPFVEKGVPNMGLEKYGQALFEGAMHDQQLRCTIINGVTRYLTGLDEYAVSVKRLPEAERKAKVKAIRETIIKLEDEIYGNKLEIDDKDFWSKTVFAPTKTEYWERVSFSIGNEGLTLNPHDPHELILIIAAEAGGFDDIAGSFEEAKGSPKPPKFYLEKKRDAEIDEAKVKQLRDRAVYELMKVFMEEPQRLFVLAKNLLPISNSYRKTDAVLTWYGHLSSFIDGSGVEMDKKKAPGKFLNIIQKPEEYLNIRAYVLEAAYLKKIITKADNKIYNRETDTLLGANLEEVVEYLRQPTNQVELDNIMEQIDAIWAK